MTLHFYTPDTLPNHTLLELREQGVDLDDWDYIILAPHCAIKWRKGETKRDADDMRGERNGLWQLLNGFMANMWYRTPTWCVGVAYHS